jgi:hypothetical protein
MARKVTNGIRSLSLGTALSRGSTISLHSEKQVCVQRDSIVLTVSCNSAAKRTGDSASSAKVSEEKKESLAKNPTDGVSVCTPLIPPK